MWIGSIANVQQLSSSGKLAGKFADVWLNCRSAVLVQAFGSTIILLRIWNPALESTVKALKSTVIAQTALFKEQFTQTQKISGSMTAGTGNTITPNDVDLNAANNNPGGTAPHEPFPDPSRTVGSYFNSIGGSLQRATL